MEGQVSNYTNDADWYYVLQFDLDGDDGAAREALEPLELLRRNHLEGIERYLRGNVLAGAHITQLVLPELLERKDGAVVNITSYAGQYAPPAPAGRGGWSFAYGASKGALNVTLFEYAIYQCELGPGLQCRLAMHTAVVISVRDLVIHDFGAVAGVAV